MYHLSSVFGAEVVGLIKNQVLQFFLFAKKLSYTFLLQQHSNIFVELLIISETLRSGPQRIQHSSYFRLMIKGKSYDTVLVASIKESAKEEMRDFNSVEIFFSICLHYILPVVHDIFRCQQKQQQHMYQGCLL